MMLYPKPVVAVFLLFLLGSSLLAQTITPFEADPDGNTTATYAQTIAFYENLAEQYPERLALTTIGMTDSGEPLHLAVVSSSGHLTLDQAEAAGKLPILVNNAIHPGEPCGVDASMLLVRDYLEKPEVHTLPEEIVLLIIPFYNVGGGLNRGAYSRANQEGPDAYGFRGNAKNLDLNRDFIKCDSRNAQAFNRMFAAWQPRIFIDNHTSNGADYQYTLTLIATQNDKLGGVLANYQRNRMLPALYTAMEKRGWEMTPYVYANGTPDQGIYGFLDLPRYSSGYAALHHCLSFMPETHMLKPFPDRVQSVYHFMQATIDFAAADRDWIERSWSASQRQLMIDKTVALNWVLDTSRVDSLLFKGYTARYKPSGISGLDRLYYDRAAPYEKTIPFYNYYRAVDEVSLPAVYLIPQAYQEVIERLQWNGVQMRRLQRDTTLTVEQYYIEDYDTGERPYEGHYLHRNVKTRKVNRLAHFRAGDYVIGLAPQTTRYLVSCLEPRAPDSYFAWNFFDGILQQKEYFSSYVFEDTAVEYLAANPELAAELEAAKAEDAGLAASPRRQLDFVYKRSPYYEPTHNLYPVARWNGSTAALPLTLE